MLLYSLSLWSDCCKLGAGGLLPYPYATGGEILLGRLRRGRAGVVCATAFLTFVLVYRYNKHPRLGSSSFDIFAIFSLELVLTRRGLALPFASILLSPMFLLVPAWHCNLYI